MPSFDIVKTVDIDETFRVACIMADFDLKKEHLNEKFSGDIELPDEWGIGLIVGSSGTGKTTIAKNLFSEYYCEPYKWTHKSVIDDMPDNIKVSEIEKMFYSVGFGSVPSWLKPFSVLSNGEKMRVELARALLEKDFVVFDEFTSVVDRTVAQVACMAINKAVKNNNKKFIAVSCHYDIIEWLQPDWVFDTNTMKMVFSDAHDKRKSLSLENVGGTNGQSLGSIII